MRYNSGLPLARCCTSVKILYDLGFNTIAIKTKAGRSAQRAARPASFVKRCRASPDEIHHLLHLLGLKNVLNPKI